MWLVVFPAWLMLVFTGAIIAVSLFIKLLIFVGAPLQNLSQPVLLTFADSLVYITALVVVIGVPWWVRKHKASLKELGIDRLPMWSDLILGPLGMIPYVLISGVLIVLVGSFIPGFDVSQTQDIGFSNLSGQASYLLAFLTLVVVAPLVEELLFRGYLYGKLRARSSVVTATILTSLTFALIHWQPNISVDVFGLSIVLCILREATGSIWAGVLLHTTKNSLAFYLLFISPLMVH